MMKKANSLYHGHRFPASIISCAVCWYFRFHLSLRDIEELLFEQGVTVSYAGAQLSATLSKAASHAFIRSITSARVRYSWR
jgi:transposase-like protein